MLKRLAIVGLFGALAAVCVLEGQTAPLSPPKQGIAKSDQGQGRSQQLNSNDAQRGTPDTIGSASQPSSATDKEERENERRNLEIQSKIEWFTGILAGVGILQGVVLLLTWKAIRRQANLQEFLTRQWVDIGNWKIDREDAWEHDWEINRSERTRAEKGRTLKDSLEVSISFDVFNRTAFPLELEKVIVRVGRPSQGEWRWQAFEVTSSVIIPPHSTEGDTSENYFVSVQLDNDEVYNYTKSGAYRRIYVSAHFLDSEGKRRVQVFAREVVFTEKSASFARYSSGKIRQIEVDEASPQDDKDPS